jgi:hypothetical protein
MQKFSKIFPSVCQNTNPALDDEEESQEGDDARLGSI